MFETDDRSKLNNVCQLLAQVRIDEGIGGPEENTVGARLLEVVDGSDSDVSAVQCPDSIAPTEPTDSPFRVRRFSLVQETDGATCVKCCVDELADEPSATPVTHKKNGSNASSISGSTHLFLVRRSRSFDRLDSDESDTDHEQVEEPVQKTVEALEIEIFPPEEDQFSQPDRMERPQTCPPTVQFVPNELKSQPSMEHVAPSRASTPGSRGAKMVSGVLGRMQKSINFLFRCATRRGSSDSFRDEIPAPSHAPTGPRRSATPEIVRAFKQNAFPYDSRTAKPVAQDAGSIPLSDIRTAPHGKQEQASSYVTQVAGPAAALAPAISAHHPHVFDVPGPKAPLLRPVIPKDLGKKCLVLDLDETLVHSTFAIPDAYDLVVPLTLPDGSYQNIYVAKRPGVDRFLREMCEMFEVVIFTASLSRYADPVIDFLSEGMWQLDDGAASVNIRHRLYRESCLFLQGLYVKDLSRLGRNLEHTVIVDNSPASFILQPGNGIPIRSWFNDPMDAELLRLGESLRMLAVSDTINTWHRDHQCKFVFP